jgi:hypothetical protein
MPEGIFTVPESGFCHAGKRFRIIVCHETPYERVGYLVVVSVLGA